MSDEPSGPIRVRATVMVEVSDAQNMAVEIVFGAASPAEALETLGVFREGLRDKKSNGPAPIGIVSGWDKTVH